MITILLKGSLFILLALLQEGSTNLLELLFPDLVFVQQPLPHLLEGHQVELVLVMEPGGHQVLLHQPISSVPLVPLPGHLPLMLMPLLITRITMSSDHGEKRNKNR